MCSGVLAGPWKVGGVRPTGESVVWAASGGLVSTTVIHPYMDNTPGNQHYPEADTGGTVDNTGDHPVEVNEEAASLREDSGTSVYSTIPPLASVDTLEVI